ncbi:hypothetical protein J1614_003476 [Plenodomus biglobosus]|nr:hypothetical protein J1614_003476 [Plenodomus biglobosus]
MANDSANSNASSSSTNEQPPTQSTSANPSQQGACAQCDRILESLKQCLKCHSVSYCNKDCQKANFKTHKKVCAGLAQEYTKTHEPKMATKAPPRNDARDRGLQKWQVCEDQSFITGLS